MNVYVVNYKIKHNELLYNGVASYVEVVSAFTVTGRRSSIMLDSISVRLLKISFSTNKYFSKTYWNRTFPPQNLRTRGKLMILDHFG